MIRLLSGSLSWKWFGNQAGRKKRESGKLFEVRELNRTTSAVQQGKFHTEFLSFKKYLKTLHEVIDML